MVPRQRLRLLFDGAARLRMSIASCPNENFLLFGMDLQSGSSFKKSMSKLKTGQYIQIFKIEFKNFNLNLKKYNDFIFLAGGIGITPIRSLVKEHNNVFLRETSGFAVRECFHWIRLEIPCTTTVFLRL